MIQYQPVIGLEVHVQLKTNSKMFCSCPNQYGADPNTLICPTCMGHPGALPFPNKEAIRKAIIAGLLLSCDINQYAKFDRKSYFYPDMPKNYQISQFDLPFCLNGRVPISGIGLSGQPIPEREVKLTRIHLEEDVAKSNHLGGCSGIDFNRAGVPLLEIVSEPDLFSADDAYAYLVELKETMQYGLIGDCDMEKGQMRCDVNLSLRPIGETTLGVKVELKNLNSFKAVHRAINHEILRQTEILEAGQKPIQETRGWDDDLGDSYTMRTKEDAHDYRYFPDPDLTPITFSEEELAQMRLQLPERLNDKRKRYLADYALTEYDVETLTQDRHLAAYFEEAVKEVKTPKLLANWIITELLRELSAASCSIRDCPMPPAHVAQIIQLIEKGTISGKIAKDLFSESFKTKVEPANIVKQKGLSQVSDSSVIAKIVEAVIADCPQQVNEYKAGKVTILQYLVGQTMKRSQGKANPAMVNQLLKEKLDNIQ